MTLNQISILTLLEKTLTKFEFKSGVPACPIACKYCHVTELDIQRSQQWSQGFLGMNKACTFFNIPPWINDDAKSLSNFENTSWNLFKGDFVGWTAVTDGIMPSMLPYFWKWIESLESIAKLTTVVSKWPITRQRMKDLSTIKNFYLVVTITGNEHPIEKVPSRIHLRTLACAKEYGVNCLPMCHPYISDVTNLSFLKQLKSLEYDEFCIKGLRYNSTTMGSWMPNKSKSIYGSNGLEEILPEDGWRDLVNGQRLSLLSPKKWYHRAGKNLSPKLSLEEYTYNVSELVKLCEIASSSSRSDVIEAAINRRL